MGKKAKSSRKGKKAWRANISTAEIEDFFEKSTKDALSGGSLTDLPSDSLFYVDKSKDLSVKRKIEKHREKVLRSESVLQKNPFVQAVPSSLKNAKKLKKKQKEVPTSNDAAVVASKENCVSVSGMVDLWEGEGEGHNKGKKRTKPTPIPAVEVEPPGCSFNPSFESHQDSLAKAVAEEMQKVYKKELGPQPVPLTVTGEKIDEEDMYFLDADDGSDDDKNMESDNEDIALEKRSAKKTKMVTRVELNRRARRKERQKIEAKENKKEEISKEIESLPHILQEIAREDEEKHKRKVRRVIAKQERLKARPPRLGKHKYGFV
ncbi:hypothetical protein HS088_TW11G00778 [Tripterygium wilfordii]|uniref:Ribosome biogenesis protein NOP53 n=1 Tax=Tripterygium wilfordii TaxID=458696 RepID=A0A7J7D2Z2_TRIWF|nr:hypothetical protein HS088_TW11G00778 [Tripterygium wilfordii]